MKLDIGLVRGVDADPARRALGVTLAQGYLFGKPAKPGTVAS